MSTFFKITITEIELTKMRKIMIALDYDSTAQKTGEKGLHNTSIPLFNAPNKKHD